MGICMDCIGEHSAWMGLRNLRPTTIYARQRALHRLTVSIGHPCEAQRPDLATWWQSRAYLTPEGRATELAHVRQFFRWLVTDGRREDDPSDRLIRPRLRQRLPRPIAEADLSVALAAAPERIRPWLLLAAYAGLRAGEIARLRAEDLLDLDGGPAVLIADGKGVRQRIIPLHPTIVAVLGAPGKGWLFCRLDGKPGHVPPHQVSHLSNDYLHSIGISATIHQLRHRFGSQVYQQSLDLRLTQDLLGHVSPVSTAGYAAWAPENARSTVLALKGNA